MTKPATPKQAAGSGHPDLDPAAIHTTPAP
jgi:hypothetical protein